MNEYSPIDKLGSSLYTVQSLVSTCDAVCVGNGRCFYFNEDGKLDIHVLVKIIYPVLKEIYLLFLLNSLN